MGKSKSSRKKKKKGSNNKVCKFCKERLHNEKNKATATASVSKEDENYRSHDLETVAPFKVSTAHTYTHQPAYGYKLWGGGPMPKYGDPMIPITLKHTGSDDDDDDESPPPTNRGHGHNLEIMARFGISVVHTHLFPIYDGPRYDCPPVKNCRDKKMGKSKSSRKKKKGSNNKVCKSCKERLHNEKNKATATASVSKEDENYDSHDLETVAPFKVSTAHTYTHQPAYGYKLWGGGPMPKYGDPMIPITLKHTGSDDDDDDDDDESPPPTNRGHGHNLELMARLGISVVHTHLFPIYDGPRYDCPPVKNSAGNVKNSTALGVTTFTN